MITEAVDIHRQLAEARPDAYLPYLANSLNTLSIRLGELGQHENALVAITEAIDIRRRLAHACPAAHQTELDQSLAVLAWLQKSSES